MKALMGVLGSTLVTVSAGISVIAFMGVVGPETLNSGGWGWRVFALILYLLFAEVTTLFAHDVGEFYEVVAARRL